MWEDGEGRCGSQKGSVKHIFSVYQQVSEMAVSLLIQMRLALL